MHNSQGKHEGKKQIFFFIKMKIWVILVYKNLNPFNAIMQNVEHRSDWWMNLPHWNHWKFQKHNKMVAWDKLNLPWCLLFHSNNVKTSKDPNFITIIMTLYVFSLHYFIISFYVAVCIVQKVHIQIWNLKSIAMCVNDVENPTKSEVCVVKSFLVSTKCGVYQ
jgi:hypothetical protein